MREPRTVVQAGVKVVAKPKPRDTRLSDTKSTRTVPKVIAKPPVSPSLAQTKSAKKPVFRQPEKPVKVAPRPRPNTRHEAVEAKKTYRLIIKEPYLE